MNRLRAFTLLESMLALLLLGIVGAMAISVLSYLDQGIDMGEDHVGEEEVLWLLTAFNADRTQHDGLHAAPNGDIVFIAHHDTVRYSQVEGAVVRTQTNGRTTTFKVQASAMRTELDGSGNVWKWTLVREKERMSAVHFVAPLSIAEKRNAHAHTAYTAP